MEEICLPLTVPGIGLPMASPPTGTVTFLFTDIEGSTRLIQNAGDARYAQALADHRRILLEAFTAGQGYVIETQGDAFLVAFHAARDAVLTAVAGQRALAAHVWPDGAALRVRMGLHTGEPVPAGQGYVGLDVHRTARICTAGHGGQILVSETTRQIAGDDLPQEIGFQNLGEHRLKDLTVPHRLFQVVGPDLPSDFPPLRSLNILPHNLPIQLTTFIGREREVAEVVHLISTCHLLTLTGPGGGGKTRLALQVAAEALAEHSDGVWLVELATLTDPGLVAQTVAEELSVREQPGRSHTARLVDYLREKNLLLILDNCEHVITSCAFLVEELLRACPRLRVLATSREPLRIPGEVVFGVPSLSLPAGERPSLDDLKRSEAGRLFIERATLARPAFAVREGEAAALTQICRRLDGNPLAIELAAARVKVLSTPQIAERLDDLFRLLTDGGRTTLPRHQTLLAAIDWSYEPLTEQEKRLFRRLSIFAGGWILAAAESVCAGDGIEPGDVLDLLGRLVEKSLVITESRAWETRYRMLETIRGYSRGKLAQSDEATLLRKRHLTWFLSWAEQVKPELHGPDQAEWLERLAADHDNFRASLKTSLDESMAEQGLRLAGALGIFWYRRGHLNEGKAWLAATLARGEAAPAFVRAEALYLAGRLATALSDYDAARAFDEESLRIFREQGDNRGVARSLHALGRAAEVRGDYAAARPLYEESLVIFREAGDRRGMAVVLIDLGRVTHMLGEPARGQPLLQQSLAISRELGDKLLIGATLHALGMAWKDRADYAAAQSFFRECAAIFRHLGDDRYAAWACTGLGTIACQRGDYENARDLYEDGLRVFREIGDRHRVAESLQGLGDVFLALGEVAAARRHYEESRSLYTELDHRWGSAEALGGLGGVALRLGELERVRSLFEESLRLSHDVGHKRNVGAALRGLGKLALVSGGYDRARRLYCEALVLHDSLEEKQAVAECLEGLAAVAVGCGQLDRASNLLGAACALRRVIGSPLSPGDRVEHDRSVTTIRASAGDSRFSRAWSEGVAMTLREAVACALSETEGVVPHAGSSSAS